MSLHVHIQSFEGPLPLLMHLIKSKDMDIFNINIHEITQQYLDYIKAMKNLDLEIAGEFLVMAASLVHIKSRMLIPSYDEKDNDIEDDPRRELAQRLWEYQRFQEASKNLYKRPLVGRDLWLRGIKTFFKNPKEEVLEENLSLFHLIRHYRHVIRSTKRTVHKVKGALLSIGDRILEIRDRIQVGRQISLNQLIDIGTDKDHRINQVLITFLSLLELAKMGFISLFQSSHFEDIHIHTHQVINPQVIDSMDLNNNLSNKSDVSALPPSKDNLIKPATDEEISYEASLLKEDSPQIKEV